MIIPDTFHLFQTIKQNNTGHFKYIFCLQNKITHLLLINIMQNLKPHLLTDLVVFVCKNIGPIQANVSFYSLWNILNLMILQQIFK